MSKLFGKTSQILSGDMLQATNATRSETGVNRENLAFFMQPLPEMRAWMFSRETAKTENLLKCVPLLLSRRNNY
ncbi:hypothetical protein PR003_g13806 [Phytophthora rubi]|uniref:Uncharacterized protein n=1 Tax=Phytophthora rubi TaxID=129364 RepID=A0A6A3LHS3_9STRA|nr:hypothetical protein PR001_g14011 [Phytophthora rubi]KAE9038954.1 hypothetical protein PR002_g5744 [Phytophthora rubi]KAE9333873.1 hypothetical protein PR003_g13806 [Phytophthora rubi]